MDLSVTPEASCFISLLLNSSLEPSCLINETPTWPVTSKASNLPSSLLNISLTPTHSDIVKTNSETHGRNVLLITDERYVSIPYIDQTLS